MSSRRSSTKRVPHMQPERARTSLSSGSHETSSPCWSDSNTSMVGRQTYSLNLLYGCAADGRLPPGRRQPALLTHGRRRRGRGRRQWAVRRWAGRVPPHDVPAGHPPGPLPAIPLHRPQALLPSTPRAAGARRARVCVLAPPSTEHEGPLVRWLLPVQSTRTHLCVGPSLGAMPFLPPTPSSPSN